MALNPDLLNFFCSNFRPGAIGLVGARDPIGLAVRQGQTALTADNSPSLWSHVFILGLMRLDMRGSSPYPTKSPYIFESDLKINLFSPQIRNGAQENWAGKWAETKVEHAAIADFGLTPEQTDAVLANALQLVCDQLKYPVAELVGTWIDIVMGQQWKENSLDDPHAMYCSSYVRFCYKAAGRDFLDADISVSNTSPEDIARAASRAGVLKKYEPC